LRFHPDLDLRRANGRERLELATKAEEELRVPELLDKGSPGKTRADAAKVPWSLQW